MSRAPKLTAEARLRLGTIPDRDLAAELGLSEKYIGMMRRRHGIPAHGRPPRDPDHDAAAMVHAPLPDLPDDARRMLEEMRPHVLQQLTASGVPLGYLTDSQLLSVVIAIAHRQVMRTATRRAYGGSARSDGAR